MKKYLKLTISLSIYRYFHNSLKSFDLAQASVSLTAFSRYIIGDEPLLIAKSSIILAIFKLLYDLEQTKLWLSLNSMYVSYKVVHH